MQTILSALREQEYSGDTIGKALGGGTIAEGIATIEASGTTPSENIAAYVVSFDANGGSGTVAPVACADGSTVALPNGTGLTAPSNKTFSGWGASDSATETVASPYAATASTTLYAVWAD